MNEFLKLKWRIEDPSEIDQQICFLPEEVVSDSHVYKHFSNRLKPKTKASVKLNLRKEKYIPGKKYYRQIPRRSLLTKTEKSHCLTALKLFQSGKNPELMRASEKYSIQVYKECQPKIVEENSIFLKYVQHMWNNNKNKPQKITPGICNYSWNHWKERIKRYLDYPQFYTDFLLISLNYGENESIIDYHQISNPLEMGTLARFSQPSLTEQCFLKIVTLPSKEATLNSQLPVSQDENVIKLIDTHQFDVVISSSGLKQIIDYTNAKSKWIIPLVIKEVNVNNIKKKIVFIDKVLPKTNPNHHDLKYYAYKQLLKSNFCQYKAFSFPVEEVSIHRDCDKASDITELSNVEFEETENEKKKQKKKRFIHHNVSYRIWNIKKTDNQNTLMKNKVKNKEINLLVRCKIDACEHTDQGVLYPVVIRPKIEQQIQYGANIPSKSELSRDWTSLFFRVYSYLYRGRICSNGGLAEVISVEKCTIQKINSEALTHYDYKPILGLGVLQKILEEVMNLECGNYLLQHLPKHESFLAVMKQCEEGVAKYDLHNEIQTSKIDSETKPCWLPIDVNYILPVHEEYNQIPATFQGFDNKGGKKKKKKCVKNKKKTEMKEKIQEET